MNALDASVLIAHLEAENAFHARAGTLLSALEGPLVVSPVTLAEVLVGPTVNGKVDVVLGAIDRLEVATVRLEDDAPVRLARLRADTGLKLPDCCVLLAAQTAGATSVLTFDARLRRVAADAGFATP